MPNLSCFLRQREQSICRWNRKRAGLCETTWKGKRRCTKGDRHQKSSRQLSTLASMRSGSSGMWFLSVLRANSVRAIKLFLIVRLSFSILLLLVLLTRPLSPHRAFHLGVATDYLIKTKKGTGASDFRDMLKECVDDTRMAICPGLNAATS